MSKVALVVATSFILLGTAAFAADEPDDHQDAKPSKTESAPAKKTTAKPVAKKAADKSLMAERMGAVRDGTVRMTSVAAGTLLGLPVAAGRMIYRADIEQAKSIPFIGEKPKGLPVWVSRAIVIPTSGFSGIVVAPFTSAVNAWKASEDKPFSKECFSFGEMADYISTY